MVQQEALTIPASLNVSILKGLANYFLGVVFLQTTICWNSLRALLCWTQHSIRHMPVQVHGLGHAMTNLKVFSVCALRRTGRLGRSQSNFIPAPTQEPGPKATAAVRKQLQLSKYPQDGPWIGERNGRAKIGTPTWDPGKWNQRLEHAVFCWFHFDPYLNCAS